MASIIAWLKKCADSPFGKAVEILVYVVMLLLVLIFFSGNGEFIYEAF